MSNPILKLVESNLYETRRKRIYGTHKLNTIKITSLLNTIESSLTPETSETDYGSETTKYKILVNYLGTD